MSAHRKERTRRVRPRVRRIAAASVSATITTVALLGAVGVIPLGGAGSAATQDLADHVIGAGTPQSPAQNRAELSSKTTTSSSKHGTKTSTTAPKTATATVTKAKQVSPTALPASSGS